jgi:hypothetical protein
MKAQIEALQADYQAAEDEVKRVIGQEATQEKELVRDRQAIAKARKAD